MDDSCGETESSSEELSVYSESPSLAESDLCGSDVDTDDLLCTTDTDIQNHRLSTDNDSPEHEASPNPCSATPKTPPPLKKAGSFFQFMMKRARKWKKKKAKDLQTQENGSDPEIETSLMIPTVCETKENSLTHASEVYSLNSVVIDDKNRSSELKQSDSTSTASTILDPTKLVKALNSSEHRAIEAEICREMRGVLQKDHETLDSAVTAVKRQSAEEDLVRDGRIADEGQSGNHWLGVNRLPGLVIPKMGYYGLSEGDIPLLVESAVSEQSINTVLSEEDLLVEYVHDLSDQVSAHHFKDLLRLPKEMITNLVYSMEDLSIKCPMDEMIPKAVVAYRSLLDIRHKPHRQVPLWSEKQNMKTAADWKLTRDDSVEAIDDEIINLNIARSDWENVPLASGESSPCIWNSTEYLNIEEEA